MYIVHRASRMRALFFARESLQVRARGWALLYVCGAESHANAHPFAGGERKNNATRAEEAALCRIHFRSLAVIFVARYAPVTFAVFTTASPGATGFRSSSVFRLLTANNGNKHRACGVERAGSIAPR